MIRYYKLFDLLSRRGLKKVDLKPLANITGATLARLGQGKSVNTDTIDKICSVLGVQPADIMEYVPNEPAEAEK